MAQLTEEVGSRRIIARRYEQRKESDKNKDLGDLRCCFVVLCLANQTGIDLQASDKKWI
jgi:hypothetical protein